MKNISIKIVVLLTGLIIGVNAIGASDLPDCPSGAIYFKKNCFGTYTYARGGKYVGEFQDGARNGQGTTTYANGSVKEGIWKDGNFLGTVAEAERAEKTREQEAQVKREKEDKFDRIYSACLLDKAANVDMAVSSLEKALKVTCTSIAKDPSFLESLRYN
jgi:hypothetical protein